MFRKLTTTACAAALLLGVSARADVNDKVKAMTSPKDSKEFAMKAAEGGMLEVKLSQLAQQKSQSQDIKALAQKLEQDHTMANNELMAAAKAKNIDLPSDLKGEASETYQAFQKLEGKDFDNSYLLFNVKDHVKDIAMFQNEANSGTDAEIKAFAAKTLPHLKMHAAQIGKVAQSNGLPVDNIASAGNMGAGDNARPAGGRIEGTNSGAGTGTGTGTGGTGTGNRDRLNPQTGSESKGTNR